MLLPRVRDDHTVDNLAESLRNLGRRLPLKRQAGAVEQDGEKAEGP